MCAGTWTHLSPTRVAGPSRRFGTPLTKNGMQLRNFLRSNASVPKGSALEAHQAIGLTPEDRPTGPLFKVSGAVDVPSLDNRPGSSVSARERRGDRRCCRRHLQVRPHALRARSRSSYKSATQSVPQAPDPIHRQREAGYSSFALSAFACRNTAVSGSASLHNSRNLW